MFEFETSAIPKFYCLNLKLSSYFGMYLKWFLYIFHFQISILSTLNQKIYSGTRVRNVKFMRSTYPRKPLKPGALYSKKERGKKRFVVACSTRYITSTTQARVTSLISPIVHKTRLTPRSIKLCRIQEKHSVQHVCSIYK